MIFWTGICWACTKCGSAFDFKCPICGVNPEDEKTEHKVEICSCPTCKKAIGTTGQMKEVKSGR